MSPAGGADDGAPARGRGRGGRREGAGRNPKGPIAGVAHHPRPKHAGELPAFVTWRVAADVAGAWGPEASEALAAAVASSRKRSFRVCHYAVRADRLLFLVEAGSADSLSRGLQGLGIRIARTVNSALARGGSFYVDRYLSRDLATGQEVRDALVALLVDPSGAGAADAKRSSAGWFDGWKKARPRPKGRSPVARAQTKLLSKGWRERGLL